MSASRGWVGGEPTGWDDPPAPVGRPRRDWDRAHEVVIAWMSLIAVVAATLGGAYILTVTVAAWAGAGLVLAVGVLGIAYTGVTKARRRAAAEQPARQAEFRAGGAGGFGGTPADRRL